MDLILRESSMAVISLDQLVGMRLRRLGPLDLEPEEYLLRPAVVEDDGETTVGSPARSDATTLTRSTISKLADQLLRLHVGNARITNFFKKDLGRARRGGQKPKSVSRSVKKTHAKLKKSKQLSIRDYFCPSRSNQMNTSQ
ncbi:unnamed protein product [Durusdinium trenchii]|uniref:Uncharacterized protein n=1 Tax=Durusdinium trenchii TaxID=1381693 RepID=A0ABP0NM73_9DINO